MKSNLETYTLPACWASYLVNGDASGITGHEQIQADQFLADKSLGGCVGCSDESSFSRYHDAQYLTGRLAGDVLEYTFPILKK